MSFLMGGSEGFFARSFILSMNSWQIAIALLVRYQLEKYAIRSSRDKCSMHLVLPGKSEVPKLVFLIVESTSSLVRSTICCFDQFSSSSTSGCIVCWVVFGVNVVPFVRGGVITNPLYSVSNKRVETSCFVGNVSKDNFAFCPKALGDTTILQFFPQEGTYFRRYHGGGKLKPWHSDGLQ